MTILRSEILTWAGFKHGFGTRRSTLDDYPADVHILVQVHGERIVALTKESGARSQEPGENRRLQSETAVDKANVGERRSKNLNLVVRSLPEKPFRFDEGDALITDIPGASIGIRTADCLPILVGDTTTGAAAAIHCGWRSLALGLAGKGVRALISLTGSDPGSFIAALGPSIGPCCYEVGQEVRDAFSRSPESPGLFESKGRSLYLDLRAGAGAQLLAEGLDSDSIEETAGCTSCEEARFWSWRARRNEERMISFIRAKV